MSAALPPVPDLIPISALRKGSGNNNNNNSKVVRECAPCSSTQCSGEVMGEQRSRRTGQPAAFEVIDTSRSRGSDGAAPQPASRKARTERHRKSDRRRDRDRERRKRSTSSKPCSLPSSPERPANPRVNPIFVWVRQKDNHIVEVKCEDYDKRNRILLTKTAQGWRAIPRTETLAPALQKSDDKPKKVKKRTNGKVKRKSAAVQVENDDLQDPSWTEISEPPEQTPEKSPPSSVNSGCAASDCSAQDGTGSATADCHNKCDVTPLDNLLAVAELEFNQHIQQEQWESKASENEHEHEQEPDDQINNMEQLDMFIESCAPTDPPTDLDETKQKSDDCECDYTEEEENNLAMDDILNRLEQSLRSPDTLHSEINEIIKQTNPEKLSKPPAKPVEPKPVETNKPDLQEVPTDLTTSKEKFVEFENNNVDDMMPTDLSVPKCPSSPKRPPSQNSETIQSPQPSGIPAIPPSPDIYHHHNSANKNKSSIYLESLLSSSKEVTTDKEPLDLGKPRESDSPRVTCSQEIQSPPEPPPKKLKLEDLTLKKLLDNEKKDVEKNEGKNETPRLLELLTHDSEQPDPLSQLKQVYLNANLNVPDPMLIPKELLSSILSNPAKEIPKLLSQRPELRLPEALAYPQILQNPDILVITLAQLEIIVQKQSQSIPLTEKEDAKKPPESPKATSISSSSPPKSTPREETGKTKKAKMSELSSDIDAATNAAFTQMMWLPYLNQLENAAMSFGGNPELLKMLSTMLPNYAGPEMSHMMSNNRLPFPLPAFPMQPPMNYNPLELSMWQEAMLQANLGRNKNQFDLFGKDYGNAKSLFPKPNPYLNVPAQFQPPISRPNLQIPQYNPHNNQKFPGKPHNKHSPNSSSKNNYQNSFQQKLYENEKLLLQQQQQQQQQQQVRQREMLKQQEYLKHQEMYAQKPKVSCKAFANISGAQHEAAKRPSSGRVPGPIDLSGSTATSGSKLKVKQHLVDHANAPRLLKHDDVPEVGSTTASIEEMQDAQKHLWHPLFGNQKSYASPWNWTTVTATGE